jgi:uncharacterized protein with HEPN domain
VLDILEAIANVNKRLPTDAKEFTQDELIQVWIIHHLWVIGEASSYLTSELRGRHPELPWSDIIGMRHMLIHQYFRRNLKTIWRTAVTDLPLLKEIMEAELAHMPEEDQST